MRAEKKCIALDAARSRFRELADRLTTCHDDVRAELRQVADELGPPADYDAFLEDQIPGTPHHELHRWAESLAEDLDTDAADLLRTAAEITPERLEDEWRQRNAELRLKAAVARSPTEGSDRFLDLAAAEAHATAHVIRAACARLLASCALLALPPDAERIEAEGDEAALRRYPALRLFLLADQVIRNELIPAAQALERTRVEGAHV